MSDKSGEQKIINEFSSKFMCQGLVGMFASDLYESVEVKITFHKRRTAKTKERARTTPNTTKDKIGKRSKGRTTSSVC